MSLRSLHNGVGRKISCDFFFNIFCLTNILDINHKYGGHDRPRSYILSNKIHMSNCRIVIVFKYWPFARDTNANVYRRFIVNFYYDLCFLYVSAKWYKALPPCSIASDLFICLQNRKISECNKITLICFVCRFFLWEEQINVEYSHSVLIWILTHNDWVIFDIIYVRWIYSN